MNFNQEDFIYSGETRLIDEVSDIFWDELPEGWSAHYIDEVVEFVEGFYTTVNYEGEKILYHLFVCEEDRGQGHAKKMARHAYENGVRIVFNPNEECQELLMALDEDENITFKTIGGYATCSLEEVGGEN